MIEAALREYVDGWKFQGSPLLNLRDRSELQEKHVFSWLCLYFHDFKIVTMDQAFSKYGIKEVKTLLHNNENKEYFYENEGRPNLLIFQPFGIYTAPDILMTIGSKLEPIEVKSSKTGRPEFGDGPPYDGFHYIIANSTTWNTKYSKGISIEHILKDLDPEILEVRQRFHDVYEEYKELSKKKRYRVLGKDIGWNGSFRERHKGTASVV